MWLMLKSQTMWLYSVQCDSYSVKAKQCDSYSVKAKQCDSYSVKAKQCVKKPNNVI